MQYVTTACLVTPQGGHKHYFTLLPPDSSQVTCSAQFCVLPPHTLVDFHTHGAFVFVIGSLIFLAFLLFLDLRLCYLYCVEFFHLFCNFNFLREK